MFICVYIDLGKSLFFIQHKAFTLLMGSEANMDYLHQPCMELRSPHLSLWSVLRTVVFGRCYHLGDLLNVSLQLASKSARWMVLLFFMASSLTVCFCWTLSSCHVPMLPTPSNSFLMACKASASTSLRELFGHQCIYHCAELLTHRRGGQTQIPTSADGPSLSNGAGGSYEGHCFPADFFAKPPKSKKDNDVPRKPISTNKYSNFENTSTKLS